MDRSFFASSSASSRCPPRHPLLPPRRPLRHHPRHPFVSCKFVAGCGTCGKLITHLASRKFVVGFSLPTFFYSFFYCIIALGRPFSCARNTLQSGNHRPF